MSFDLETALRRGFERTVQRNALVLVGVFVAIGLATTVIQNSIARRIHEDYLDYDSLFAGLDPAQIEEFRTAVEDMLQFGYLDLSPGTLLGLLVAAYVFRMAIKVGAIRTLVGEETDRLPVANFTRRLGWVLLNLIVGGIVYFLLVGLGLVLFVLPGIFLAVALFFYNYEIVVADKNVAEAFVGSWNLTRGNRIGLFVLGAAVAVIATIVGFLAGFFALAGDLPELLARSVVGGFVAVFGIAVAARAYDQLREEDPTDGSESVGALGPDDLT